MKRIAYSKAALKTLRKIPANEAKRITEKVALYASDSDALANNVRILTGSSYIRLRVADWRVILDEQGNVIEVLKIGPRGSIYD